VASAATCVVCGVEQGHGRSRRRGVPPDPAVELGHVIDPVLAELAPRWPFSEPRLQLGVVADQRETVDLADEAPLRACLELAWWIAATSRAHAQRSARYRRLDSAIPGSTAGPVPAPRHGLADDLPARPRPSTSPSRWLPTSLRRPNASLAQQPVAADHVAHGAERHSGARAPIRRTSMDLGNASALSTVAAHSVGRPSSGPSDTSVGIDRAVRVSGATRTVLRTSMAGPR